MTSTPSHGLNIQTETGIGHFFKPSNPSHGMDIQSVTPYCHGLNIQSKSRIGHPNRDLVWMILKVSNPSHGLDVQSVTGIGRLQQDKLEM